MQYTLKVDVCPHCLRSRELLYVGESQCNWAFALYVFPEKGINGLADWEKLFKGNDIRIEDEQKNIYSPNGMLSIIRGEGREGVIIRRRKPGSGCISNGDGLFDLLNGNEHT